MANFSIGVTEKQMSQTYGITPAFKTLKYLNLMT